MPVNWLRPGGAGAWRAVGGEGEEGELAMERMRGEAASGCTYAVGETRAKLGDGSVACGGRGRGWTRGRQGVRERFE